MRALKSQRHRFGNKGQNTWRYQTDNAGNAVTDAPAAWLCWRRMEECGSAAAVHLTVQGPATGVQKQNNALQLQLGALSVDFSAVIMITISTFFAELRKG